MVYFGAFFCNFVMEYLSAWKELRFGILRFSVALLVPVILVILHLSFFGFFRSSANNHQKLFVFREKWKNEKNATYTYNQKICVVILFLVETSSTSTKKFLLTHKNIFSYQKIFFPLLPPFFPSPKNIEKQDWKRLFSPGPRA